ncbi:hypothetical protein BDB00DRAFT_879266 [Zychaea mexicana]|uniref:uncharacterized protein n=1 Tax=Zychaea mexicana TaxID=64656 RepID=UPI0022FDFFBE|nr:uncharacterized protein BDB00DRAFT_879266 [Zychaea mexicana]KAI9479582.1 hypothetical protein BDB00DRAFT_879266 [Zychaea mexicana]
MNLVILAYNRLLEKLELYMDKCEDTWPELVHATQCGWEKLKGYYCKAQGHSFAVATAMDPRLKYEWWEDEKWGEYREEAIEMVQKTWQTYKPSRTQEPSPSNPDALIKKRRSNTDQLERYVSTDTVINESDASSTGSERLFSGAKQYIPSEWNRLGQDYNTCRKCREHQSDVGKPIAGQLLLTMDEVLDMIPLHQSLRNVADSLEDYSLDTYVQLDDDILALSDSQLVINIRNRIEAVDGYYYYEA